MREKNGKALSSQWVATCRKRGVAWKEGRAKEGWVRVRTIHAIYRGQWLLVRARP